MKLRSRIGATSLVAALALTALPIAPAAAVVPSGLVALGGNDDGIYGNGTTVGGATPVDVDLSGTALDGEDIVDWDGGMTPSSVALTASGKIVVWGDNFRGQLGTGDQADVLTPQQLDTTGTPLEGKTIVDVAAAFWNSYAVTSDGQVAAWGAGASGALGDGAQSPDVARPQLVSFQGTPLEGKVIDRIWATVRGAIVHATDGTLGGWGANALGAIVPGGPAIITPEVLDVAGTPLEGATLDSLSVSQRGMTIIAIINGGTAVSWGDGDFGQLGNGVPGSNIVPAVIPALAGRTIVEVQQSSNAVIARDSEGRVYTWGSNALGQAGNGTASNDKILSPYTVQLPASAVKVNAGGGHNLALLEDGTLYGWGRSAEGQLGEPTASTGEPTPRLLNGAGSGLEGKVVSDIKGFALSSLIILGEPAVVIDPVSIATPADGAEVEARPTLTGAGEPGAVLTFSTGAGNIGTATVGVDGAWTFRPAADLPSGPLSIAVVQDADGSTDTVSLVVQTPPTVAPVKISSPSDGATVSGKAKLTGTGEPNAKISITNGGSEVATATVDADGNWTVTLSSALAAGTHVLTATQDVDGSTDTVTVEVRAVDPALPGTGGGSTPPDDGELATTGFELPLVVPAVALLLLASGALLLWRRKGAILS